MPSVVIGIFIFVYLGMVLGRIPGLALDRTGVALLGAIALLAFGDFRMADFGAAVDIPSLALLFGLMVVSAQFRLGGFYTYVVRKLAEVKSSAELFLAYLIGLVGVLSAVLANDIVCLAVAPVLVELCAKRELDPKPFLLALACAANVGSAATLIGNPQNMLIGQVMGLSFGGYLAHALVPSAVGLVIVWAVIVILYKGRWNRHTNPPMWESPRFDGWQSGKGLAVLGGLMVCFLFAPWPREIVALVGGGVLLCSRHMRSREMLGLVDWQLLLLFLCLFVVNYALRATGSLDQWAASLASAGIDIRHPAWLFGITVPLSNLVSNVPAVMLLLPYAAGDRAGAVLALSSTLAGNLLIVGSIANIIVVDQASRLFIRISWSEHARVGVPVTVITCLVAAVWLWLTA